jgi:predicted DCC family thiol-disulfide oxidoreductase YuxK
VTEPLLIVLFDEGCGFCTRLAGWLEQRPMIAVEPIGSPTGARLLRDLPPERRYDTVHVVDGRGRRFSGAEALPPLLCTLPGLAWAAPIAEAFPRPLEWGYELVARHRGALSRLLRTHSRTAAPGAAGSVEERSQSRHNRVTHPRARPR